MRRSLSAVVIGTLAFSTPVLAQADWVKDLLLAAQLPIIALEARNDGVPNSDIGSILEAVRRAGLPSRDAVLILDTVRVLRRDYGPTDNFGAFVQSQLAEGKRGTSLAAAIRAEHVRMGKGGGNAGARGANAGRGRGAPNTPSGAGTANPGARGKSGNPGKPPATTPARGKSDAGRGRGGPPSR
jgi:hypothetical protein